MKRLELLRERLYQKAKENQQRTFHSLHDKLCRQDVLNEAWRIVAANHGSPGVDGQTIEDIREYGVEKYLNELGKQLANKTYTVGAVRRTFIPKSNGRMRPLGIPTVRDRLVQQAVKLVIEPIFEADFKDFSYGYRPKRSAKQASQKIVKYLNYGCIRIIDADISGFFDHINHDKMMFFVSKRVADPYVLKLIREWLRAGIVFQGNTSYPQEGTPQGGVISPLLANIYLNQLDTIWTRKNMDSRYGSNAHLIRYADDVVILTDRDPEYAMGTLERIITLLGLELNHEKTGITTAREGFDFLGFHFVRKTSRVTGKESTYLYPSGKSVKHFRENISIMTRRRVAFHKPMGTAVSQANDIIRGWHNYYGHTNASTIFRSLQKYVEWKLAKYYCFIHKIGRVSAMEGIYDRVRDYGLADIRGRIEYFRNA